MGETHSKLSTSDIRQYLEIARGLKKTINGKFPKEVVGKFKDFVKKNISRSSEPYNDKNISEALLTLNTALLFAQAVEPDQNILVAIGLYPFLKEGLIDILQIKKEFGEDIAGILTGLESVDKFSNKGCRGT